MATKCFGNIFLYRNNSQTVKIDVESVLKVKLRCHKFIQKTDKRVPKVYQLCHNVNSLKVNHLRFSADHISVKFFVGWPRWIEVGAREAARS